MSIWWYAKWKHICPPSWLMLADCAYHLDCVVNLCKPTASRSYQHMLLVLCVDNRCIPMLQLFRHTILLLQLTALHIRCTPFPLPTNHTTACQPSRCLCHRGHLLPARWLAMEQQASRLRRWVSHSTVCLHMVQLVVVVAISLIQCLGHLLATRHQQCIHSSQHQVRCTCRHQHHQHNKHRSPALVLLSINHTTCSVSVIALYTMHSVSEGLKCSCRFKYFFSLPGWANSISGQKLSVCVSVC